MIKRKRLMLVVTVMLLLSMFLNIGIMEVFAATDLNTKLKDNVIPLKTTIAESGFEDLEPLREILKDKRIIGLGESTLGAKEFYEMKHRIVEFLVEEMDYRLFAIDAEVADIKVVNDYIQNGDGNIDDAIWALRQFNWSSTRLNAESSVITAHAYLSSWTTTEVANMIEWMKNYNNNIVIKDKIKFYGIDIEIPENSIDDLFEYLYIVDEEIGSKYSKKLSDLVIIHGFSFKYPSARPLGLFTGMMEELEAKFISSKEEYIDKTSANKFEIAYHDINTINQWIDYRGNNLNYGTDAALKSRDYHMAENVKWILDFEKQFDNDKIVVLAHNRSIAKKVNNHVPMGEHLQAMFKDEYYAMGLDFYQGRFRAFGVDIWGNPISNYLAKFNIKSSPENTLSYKLEQTDIPISYLDFKKASEDQEISELLSSNQGIHNIGLMYPGKYAPERFLSGLAKQFYDDIPMEAYDGLIFIKEVSETTGVYDKRDTKIEDGDKAVIKYYWHILFGQMYSIIAILIVAILVTLLIRKKIRAKIEGKGARYPSSSRWS